RLLERAEAGASQLEDWPLANLHEMRRQRDHAIATPPSLIARLAKATARAEVYWVEAKKANDFKLLAPHLDEVVHLVRDKAALLGQARGLAPYDALVDGFTPGISTADIDTIFKALSRKLPGLINDAIEVQAAHAPIPLAGKFTVARQRSLSVDVLKAMGFPFDRGRLDESEHPFTEGVPGDIRVTTRFDPNDPFSGLLGAVHETGHAMYDLGLPLEWRDQPVGRDRGLALEESQSLLFEMNLCRSRSFVKYVRPLMEKYLQVSGPEWEEANLYRHLIRVRRSTIRMDADELTYPVHIMLRYELEKRILEGSLPVADLPEAWNANLEQRLNIRPTNDVDGCLQDIHWAVGHFGYFPSYVLGAVIAGQLNEALRAALPKLDEEIAAGQFGGVMDWLRDNVHGVGARLPVQDLIKQATGKPLTAAAYLRYLEAKYLETP
ncbi:MAG TPA: carboxypeptidase M32, partial [Steroidobacteraceae bacterium]|nr:carboxypeptidase M32 [Steroidobacteraceae bacterium]